MTRTWIAALPLPLLAALILTLVLALDLFTAPPTAADPLPGPGGLRPGCGYQPQRSQSCFRAAKAGPGSTLICQPGNRSADPWLVSSQITGKPYTSYPDFTKPKVARAGRQRYGLSDPRPPGFWPLGGFDGPWAEGFWTGKAALQFFWDNPDLRPPSLRLGSPSEWDGVCSQREQYDLSAFGGRWIIQEWQRVRDGGGTSTPPPVQPRFRVNPASPRAGQSVTFDARSSTGAIAIFRWDLGDGTIRTGRTVRHSYGEPGEYSVFLQVQTAQCNEGACTQATSQVVVVRDETSSTPPPSPPQPVPPQPIPPPPVPPPPGGEAPLPRDCGPHPTCIFLVTNGHWTRYIPDVSSTGRIVLEMQPAHP